MKDKNSQYKIDYILILILLTIGTVSCFAIASAQPSLPPFLQNINFVLKQIQWYIIGFIAIGAIMIIDFDRYKQIAWYLYIFAILLLIGLELTVPGAVTIKGATAWYRLPGLGNFQPSEIMKLFLIIVVGRIIANHNEKYPFHSPREDLLLLGKIFGTSLPPLLLIAKEPDLGNTMVISAMLAAMILVSGIRWHFIFGLTSLIVFIGSMLTYIYFAHTTFFKGHILKEYQLNRFYGWLAPYEYDAQGFQLRQAFLAAGSGEMQGKGWENGQVYFPEPHTDFIFTNVAEQFGFLGASVIISLFFLLIYRMIHIALESNEPFGSYICAGTIGMFTFQVFQNIGMTIGLLPITGITLPLMSYGGSSLLTYMVAIGFILNVRSRTKIFMFK
ncbi:MULTISPECIES: FtsW/RodA/SpoVE family cell cycle protein [Bacillus cereus group]|uniref:FtsW/RodA/SpoVE family cell cycle protein n=1 Tax=Bacillus cereus group TaxID=86661 RepID=UPI0022DFCBAA|nr:MULTISPECIES: FtsW/RodA/SpoVE family cell cycle protein [Bacillus cereus group]MDA2026232.1 FtsW/RodA/SpoVE family cell cycle protein [Bacillus cereus group sp. Bcc03]MDA2216064.1 FtsW/RodA/SpoVE family cell cycle protein [Bacillus cereus group sp. Bc228]MDA2227671.1 FtsW/RodA/SpoVE family cell cycle protein [Bacillus cereus group sp. Bc227]MDA2712935.1 FtsW/RodA/SpoVE family cell cycle protein [Bacillus cereus group sp. Bc025]WJE71988.1 FtsW/RodA/SpoVE family cell cycle protein [Bacillus a